MKKEIWKPIKDYPSYLISNKGRVKSLRFKKLMKPYVNSKGYHCVSLTENKKVRLFKISRLVLITFKPRAKQKEHCAHLNGKPSDNRLENLVWATAKENSAHKMAHGTILKGVKHPRARLTKNQIETIRKNYKHWYYGKYGSRYFATLYNVDISTIIRAAKGISYLAAFEKVR